MTLLFLSIVYFLSVRLFPICCVGVLSVSLMEVRTMELAIFIIGTYWFNIISIVKSLISAHKRR